MAVVRSVTLLLCRNSRNDSQKGDIHYKGFDICWPDGSPTQVAFARFCAVGIRTVFGKEEPHAKSYRVTFQFWPCAEDEPRPRLPKGIKARRMYICKDGDLAVLYFHNGVPTDMVFSSHDDPRVLEWVGWNHLFDGRPAWFDFVASVVQAA